MIHRTSDATESGHPDRRYSCSKTIPVLRPRQGCEVETGPVNERPFAWAAKAPHGVVLIEGQCNPLQNLDWYAWQDSNLRPFAPEQSGLFTILYMRSYSFQSFTSIQGACFRSKAEPVFLQLHKVGKSFATVVLRSEVRRHLPVRPPYESQHHAVEIKRSLSDPRPSKGFHLACDELEVRGCWVVYPGRDRYRLDARTEVIPFTEAAHPDFQWAPRATLIASTCGSPPVVKRASNTTPHTGGDSRFRTFVLFRHKPHLDCQVQV